MWTCTERQEIKIATHHLGNRKGLFQSCLYISPGQHTGLSPFPSNCLLRVENGHQTRPCPPSHISRSTAQPKINIQCGATIEKFKIHRTLENWNKFTRLESSNNQSIKPQFSLGGEEICHRRQHLSADSPPEKVSCSLPYDHQGAYSLQAYQWTFILETLYEGLPDFVCHWQ